MQVLGLIAEQNTVKRFYDVTKKQRATAQESSRGHRAQVASFEIKDMVQAGKLSGLNKADESCQVNSNLDDIDCSVGQTNQTNETKHHLDKSGPHYQDNEGQLKFDFSKTKFKKYGHRQKQRLQVQAQMIEKIDQSNETLIQTNNYLSQNKYSKPNSRHQKSQQRPLDISSKLQSTFGVQSKNQEFKNSFLSQSRSSGGGFRGESLQSKEARASFQPPKIMSRPDHVDDITITQQMSPTNQSIAMTNMPEDIMNVYQNKRGKTTQEARSRKSKKQFDHLQSSTNKQKEVSSISISKHSKSKLAPKLNLDLQEFSSLVQPKGNAGPKRQTTEEKKEAEGQGLGRRQSKVLIRNLIHQQSNQEGISSNTGQQDPFLATGQSDCALPMSTSNSRDKKFPDASRTAILSIRSDDQSKIQTKRKSNVSSAQSSPKDSLDNIALKSPVINNTAAQDRHSSSPQVVLTGQEVGNSNQKYRQSLNSPTNIQLIPEINQARTDKTYQRFNNTTSSIGSNYQSSDAGHSSNNAHNGQKQDKYGGANEDYMEYRNLNRKYNKVELLRLEEELKKNLTVTKITTKSPAKAHSDHHAMTEQNMDHIDHTSLGNKEKPNLNQKITSVDGGRKISTIGEMSREQTLNPPGDETQDVYTIDDSFHAQRELNVIENEVELATSKLLLPKPRTSHAIERMRNKMKGQAQEAVYQNDIITHVGGQEVTDAASRNTQNNVYSIQKNNSISSHSSVKLQIKSRKNLATNCDQKTQAVQNISSKKATMKEEIVKDNENRRTRNNLSNLTNNIIRIEDNQQSSFQGHQVPPNQQLQPIRPTRRLSGESSDRSVNNSVPSGVNPLAIYNENNNQETRMTFLSKKDFEQSKSFSNNWSKLQKTQDLNHTRSTKLQDFYERGSPENNYEGANVNKDTNENKMGETGETPFQNIQVNTDFIDLQAIPLSHKKTCITFNLQQAARSNRFSRKQHFHQKTKIMNRFGQSQQTNRLNNQQPKRGPSGICKGINAGGYVSQRTDHRSLIPEFTDPIKIRIHQVSNLPDHCISSRRLSVLSQDDRRSLDQDGSSNPALSSLKRKYIISRKNKRHFEQGDTQAQETSNQSQDPTSYGQGQIIVNTIPPNSDRDVPQQANTGGRNSRQKGHYPRTNELGRQQSQSRECEQTDSTPHIINNGSKESTIQKESTLRGQDKSGLVSFRTDKPDENVLPDKESNKNADVHERRVVLKSRNQSHSSQSKQEISQRSGMSSSQQPQEIADSQGNPMQNPLIMKNDYIDQTDFITRNSDLLNQVQQYSHQKAPILSLPLDELKQYNAESQANVIYNINSTTRSDPPQLNLQSNLVDFEQQTSSIIYIDQAPSTSYVELTGASEVKNEKQFPRVACTSSKKGRNPRHHQTMGSETIKANKSENQFNKGYSKSISSIQDCPNRDEAHITDRETNSQNCVVLYNSQNINQPFEKQISSYDHSYSNQQTQRDPYQPQLIGPKFANNKGGSGMSQQVIALHPSNLRTESGNMTLKKNRMNNFIGEFSQGGEQQNVNDDGLRQQNQQQARKASIEASRNENIQSEDTDYDQSFQLLQSSQAQSHISKRGSSQGIQTCLGNLNSQMTPNRKLQMADVINKNAHQFQVLSQEEKQIILSHQKEILKEIKHINEHEHSDRKNVLIQGTNSSLPAVVHKMQEKLIENSHRKNNTNVNQILDMVLHTQSLLGHKQQAYSQNLKSANQTEAKSVSGKVRSRINIRPNQS